MSEANNNAGAERRVYVNDDGSLDYQLLADRLPLTYSLCSYDAGKTLYRGSSRESEANDECPPEYAFFTENLAQAAEYAFSGGPATQIRKFNTKRALLLVNLDSLTYADIYRKADLERYAELAKKVEVGEDFAALGEHLGKIIASVRGSNYTGDDYDGEESDESSSNDDDDESAPRKPINALRWVFDDDDTETRMTEQQFCEMLVKHHPGIDGFARNEISVGAAREIVLLRPSQVLEFDARCRCTPEEAEDVQVSGLSYGYNLFVNYPVITKSILDGDSFVNNSAGRSWYRAHENGKRRYKLLEEFEDVHLQDLADAISEKNYDLTIASRPDAFYHYLLFKEEIMGLPGWSFRENIARGKRKREEAEELNSIFDD